jgi:hypothetical protein
MDAVDHWFKGDGGVNNELRADLLAYGADESSLPASMQAPKEFEIWPEHQDALLLFLRCQTQWRMTMNGVIGVDYGVVFSMMDLYAVDSKRQVFEDFQIMEGRAKELINDAAAKEAKAVQSKSRRKG